MRYFSINSTQDLRIIRHYPQTHFRKGYNPTLPNAHRNIKNNKFPDFLPELELEINSKAIPTNLIDKIGASFGLIVDKDLKEILELYKLPPHRFYPIKVYHNEKLMDYYWFHFIVPDIWSKINFKDSEIRIQHSFNVQNFVVLPMVDKNYVKYLNLHFSRNINFNVKPEKIILNNKFENYDIINLDFLHYPTLISNKLKKTMEAEGITGFETKLFKPLNTYHNN